jgi:hypothetical protein
MAERNGTCRLCRGYGEINGEPCDGPTGCHGTGFSGDQDARFLEPRRKPSPEDLKAGKERNKAAIERAAIVFERALAQHSERTTK